MPSDRTLRNGPSFVVGRAPFVFSQSAISGGQAAMCPVQALLENDNRTLERRQGFSPGDAPDVGAEDQVMFFAALIARAAAF